MKIRTTPSVVIRLLLWLTMLVAGALLSRHLDRLLFPRFDSTAIWHLLTFSAGVVVLRFAFRAAAAGGRELARYGKRSPETPRLETDRLVTRGIYARMRHPMLFGLALVPMGVALLTGSPAFITLVAPMEMLFVAAMVLTLEEWECRKKFGAAYDAYARSTPAVCLKPRCLRELFGRPAGSEEKV